MGVAQHRVIVSSSSYWYPSLRLKERDNTEPTTGDLTWTHTRQDTRPAIAPPETARRQKIGMARTHAQLCVRVSMTCNRMSKVFS